MGIVLSKAPGNMLQVGTKLYFRLSVPKDRKRQKSRTCITSRDPGYFPPH